MEEILSNVFNISKTTDTIDEVISNSFYININKSNVVSMTSNAFSISVDRNVNIPVESITLDKKSHTFNALNDILTLFETVLPSNVTDKRVVWISSNESIATVSSSGVVVSRSNGVCTITCKSVDGSNKSDTCCITVNATSGNIPVENVIVSPSNHTMKINQTLQMDVNIIPHDATNKNITYTSSNVSVASVNSGGLVTGKSVGKATITATSNADSTKRGSCVITIISNPIENNPPKIGTVIVAEEDYDGSYTIIYNASDADNDTITHKLKINTGNYQTISPVRNGTKYTYKGRGLSLGSHVGYVQVSDGKDVSTSSSFTINISERPTSIKAELKSAKDSYDSKYANLKNVINDIVSDGKFDEDEKELLENAKSQYNFSFAKFSSVMQKAIDSISNKKINDTKKIYDKEIADINASLDGLDGILDGAFADNILDDAERLAIKNNLNILATEKIDVDKQYETIYHNVDLTGVAKTNLKASYDAYTLKYNRLISSINDVLNKTDNLNESDRTKIDTAFNEFRSALGDYKIKVNTAIDEIAKKKATDAETNAKKHTEAQIKLVNDAISLKVSQAEYDSNKNEVSNKFSEIKQTTDSISSTVSKIEGDYVGKTQFNQTVDNFEFKFESTGKINEVVDARFHHSLLYYPYQENPQHIGKVDNVNVEGGNAIYINGVSDKTVFCGQKVITTNLKANNYTISGYVYPENLRLLSNGKAEINIEIHNQDGTIIYDSAPVSIASNKFIRVHKTVQTNKTIKWIIVRCLVRNATGTVYFTSLQVEEGNLSPFKVKSTEIREGITTIDAQGVTVSHKDGSKSKLTSEEVVFTDTNDIRKMAINKGRLCFYDANTNNNLWGIFTNNTISRFSNAKGINLSVSDYHAHFIGLGFHNEPTLANGYTPRYFMQINVRDYGDSNSPVGTNFYNEPVYVHESLKVSKDVDIKGNMRIASNSSTPHYVGTDATKNKLQLGADVALSLGVQNGTKHSGAIEVVKDPYATNGVGVKMFCNLDMQGYYSVVNSKNMLELEEKMLNSMLATTDMFEMMLLISPMLLEGNSLGDSRIINIYADLVKMEEKTIDEIPTIVKDSVIETLKASN